MAVNSTASQISYTASGATVFAFPYLFYDQTHLFVYTTDPVTGIQTLRTLTTDYTVSGVGSPSGGSVTFNSAPSNGTIVLITRIVPVTQLLTLDNNSGIPAPSVNEALDLIVMAIQQTEGTGSELDRSIKFPLGDTDSATLPAAATRASSVLAFDSVGALALIPDDDSSAAAAAASATASATSATASAASATAAAATLVTVGSEIATAIAGIPNQYSTSSSSANTYTATLASNPSSYVTGMQIALTFTHTNTGAATINLNSLGAKSILNKSSALVGGEISNSQTVYMVYDGTGFELMNPTVNTVVTGTFAAAGTTQATATVLTGTHNVVTSSTSGSAQGVALQAFAVNSRQFVNNQTANTISVWPVNGGSGAINAQSANTAYLIAPWGSALFIGTSSTQAYTSNERNIVFVDYQDNSSQSLTPGVFGTGANIKFNTKNIDTHSSYNSSTGVFTAPFTRVYQFSIQISQTTVVNGIYVSKNSSTSPIRRVGFGYANSENITGGAFSIALNVGDTVTFQVTNTNTTVTSDATQNFLNISGV